MHSFAEVFSTLTGGRLGFRYSPDEAAEMIDSLRAELKIVELSTDDTLGAYHAAEMKGVRGGQIHDYLHAVAAALGGAKTILTLKSKDFKGLVDEINIVTP